MFNFSDQQIQYASLYNSVNTREGIVEPGEETSFFDQVDFVQSFCYLRDRLNASGRSEAAILDG